MTQIASAQCCTDRAHGRVLPSSLVNAGDAGKALLYL